MAEAKWGPVHEASTRLWSARSGPSWARVPQRASKEVGSAGTEVLMIDDMRSKQYRRIREFSGLFRLELPERKETRLNPMAERKQSKMESRPMRIGTEEEESLDPVTRKHFFEQKQLVTLRAQH
ncbi:hypothetical protein NDU88_002318 [Pleurodeles waltl]|uniref:Uncharacterized protein n=1 Tax=Pleurodeles waltl TaxID=8319 RepID=A0AAV7T2X2_PLEWA|nr:hypothetical protein NDU88_002318 [Pleurodeles waltl]